MNTNFTELQQYLSQQKANCPRPRIKQKSQEWLKNYLENKILGNVELSKLFKRLTTPIIFPKKKHKIFCHRSVLYSFIWIQTDMCKSVFRNPSCLDSSLLQSLLQDFTYITLYVKKSIISVIVGPCIEVLFLICKPHLLVQHKKTYLPRTEVQIVFTFVPLFILKYTKQII